MAPPDITLKYLCPCTDNDYVTDTQCRTKVKCAKCMLANHHANCEEYLSRKGGEQITKWGLKNAQASQYMEFYPEMFPEGKRMEKLRRKAQNLYDAYFNSAKQASPEHTGYWFGSFPPLKDYDQDGDVVKVPDEHSQLYGELEELRERLGQWAK